MQEIIRITTNEQGSQVVSAKELYQFLGFELANWKRWAKKNIEQNTFAIENVDWFLLIIKTSSNNGIMSNDYALSLDFSKRLAMMARTEKGEQARQYFLDCERKATRVLSPAEQLLANAQMLVDIERKQNEMDSRLRNIEESRNKATEALLLAERSTEALPEETTRAKIRRIINQYCNAKNADQRSVWHVIYDRLYYRYGISLRAIKKQRKESTLDVAERLGHLDKIFVICSNELN